jgi:hypothetical protein
LGRNREFSGLGTLEEMKQNYEQQRDQEFASHACPAHTKTKTPKTK